MHGRYHRELLPSAIIGIVLVLFLGATASAQNAGADQNFGAVGFFPDVPPAHGNFEAIQFLAESGFVQGYPDGFFRPERIVNRAETTAIIVRALGETPHPAVFRDCFLDVRDQWFAAPICLGESNLWWQGYPGSPYFLPERIVIHAEALRMVLEAFQINLVAPLGNLSKKWDIPKGFRIDGEKAPEYDGTTHWWHTYFLTAKIRDYLDVTPFSTEYITRAQLAEIIYRVVLDSRGEWVPSPVSPVDL